MQSLNCKSLKIRFLWIIAHFIGMRIFFTTKFCINCSLQFVKTVFNRCKKCWYWITKSTAVRCKIFKYKTQFYMDAKSAKNVDFKHQKMQVSHCNNCRFWLHLIYITVNGCIHWMTVKNALKLQWENGHSEYL